MKTILAAFAALFLLAAPALAADAPACENTLASATEALDANGVEYKLLPVSSIQALVDEVVEPIVGSDISNVTNVLVAVLGGQVVFGIKDGTIVIQASKIEDNLRMIGALEAAKQQVWNNA